MSKPDAVSKVAHFGMLAIENVNASPSVSEALGWNEYCVPATTVTLGVPVIEGGLTEDCVAVGGDVEVVDAGAEGSVLDTPSPLQPAATTTSTHKK